MTAQAATTDTLTDTRPRTAALVRRLAVRLGPSALPGLVMIALTRYHLGKPTLGWDELATLTACRRSLGQIFDLAKHMDGVIAPYYLFMHFWTGAFGIS
ncbi:MAG: hypothetical protein HOV83_41130, partial [Catenulispora sp.]|nr:hypothetical protein [Catenulispora sp.]